MFYWFIILKLCYYFLILKNTPFSPFIFVMKIAVLSTKNHTVVRICSTEPWKVHLDLVHLNHAQAEMDKHCKSQQISR